MTRINDPRRVDYKVTEPAIQFLLNDLGNTAEVTTDLDGKTTITIEFNKFYNLVNSTSDNVFKDIIQAKEIKTLTRTLGTVTMEFDAQGRITKISMPETRLGTTKSADKYLLSFTCTFTQYDKVPYTFRTDLEAALEKYNKEKKTNYELPSKSDSISDVISDD